LLWLLLLLLGVVRVVAVAAAGVVGGLQPPVRAMQGRPRCGAALPGVGKPPGLLLLLRQRLLVHPGQGLGVHHGAGAAVLGVTRVTQPGRALAHRDHHVALEGGAPHRRHVQALGAVVADAAGVAQHGLAGRALAPLRAGGTAAVAAGAGQLVALAAQARHVGARAAALAHALGLAASAVLCVARVLPLLLLLLVHARGVALLGDVLLGGGAGGGGGGGRVLRPGRTGAGGAGGGGALQHACGQHTHRETSQ
jgi:hypothetical protein